MKKLLITSQMYGGVVEVAYGPKNELLTIDFSEATIEPNQVRTLKYRVPEVFEHIRAFEEMLGSKTIRVIQEDINPSFEDDFWRPYNKAINKQRCILLWDKLSKADKVLAVYGIKHYQKHLRANTWKTKSDPENYLKKKYWLNDWN